MANDFSQKIKKNLSDSRGNILTRIAGIPIIWKFYVKLEFGKCGVHYHNHYGIIIMALWTLRQKSKFLTYCPFSDIEAKT